MAGAFRSPARAATASAGVTFGAAHLPECWVRSARPGRELDLTAAGGLAASLAAEIRADVAAAAGVKRQPWRPSGGGVVAVAPMLLAGLSVFGAASLAGGLTDSPGQLIAARSVMGVGAAMVFPSTLSLISNVFRERDERALAIGLWGAITGVAIALGPIVGGWLLEAFGWRSIFFAMTPIAMIAGVLVARYVPASRDAHAPRIDLAGFALSAAMIRLLVYTLIEAPDHGWASARTIASFALTAVLVAAFVAWERRTEQPMLDLSLFRNARFTAASVSVAISFFALSGFIFLVTQYFQFLKGYGPLSTGVRLLPVASCVAISSVLGTKLAVRLGTKLVVASGLFLTAAFYLWVTTAAAATSYGTIAAQMVVLGTGHGPDERSRDRGDHGCGPDGEGGCRVGGQRRHAAAGRHAWGRRDWQCVRLAVRQPAHERAPRGVANYRRADRAGICRRCAHDVSQAVHAGHPALAAVIHNAASSAFFNGFRAANHVAAGVAAAGAVMALALLPAHPTIGSDETPDRQALGSPATVVAGVPGTVVAAS